MTKYFNAQALTQKAKGIALLQASSSSLVRFSTIRPPENVTLLQGNSLSSGIAFPCFARPCPMKPRHGFVDSRPVHNFSELIQVWNEAIAADPCAEIILMPFYSGRLSAVAHSSGVVWGKGHDGATAGNGALNIPCTGSRFRWATFTGSSPSIGIVNEGWVELVENDYELIAVQLRDGPAIETNADFIPAHLVGMEISRIVTVNDLDVLDTDPEALLRWEKYIASLASVPGVVIALPNKTLASHFAVHGIVAGIPVICSEAGIAKLKIGDKLDGVASTARLKHADLKTIADYSQVTKTLEREMENAWLLEAIGSLHTSSIWDNQQHLLRLRANMPVVLTRFLAAAALGELRHFSGVFRTVQFDDLDFSHVGTRDAVYTKMFQVPWKSMAEPLKFCASKAAFAGDAARGSSYGGPKWARIAKAGYMLHCQTDAFCKEPSLKRWNQIVRTCNRVVNLAHNGGYVFTKWLLSSNLDLLSECPVIGFMNLVAGEHCLNLNEGKM